MDKTASSFIASSWPVYLPIIAALVLAAGLGGAASGMFMALAIVMLLAAVIAAVNHAKVITQRNC